MLSVQSLAPIYEQLGDAFAHAKGQVFIAKVDADGAGKPLGERYEVKGFPSALPLSRTLVLVVNCSSSEVVRRSGQSVKLRRRP